MMFTNPRRNAQLITLLLSVIMIIIAVNTEHVCRSRDNPCTIKERVMPWE